MKTRSKSNNLVAILIAVILFSLGFLLYFIHEQSESSAKLGRLETPATVTFQPTNTTPPSTPA